MCETRAGNCEDEGLGEAMDYSTVICDVTNDRNLEDRIEGGWGRLTWGSCIIVIH